MEWPIDRERLLAMGSDSPRYELIARAIHSLVDRMKSPVNDGPRRYAARRPWEQSGCQRRRPRAGPGTSLAGRDEVPRPDAASRVRARIRSRLESE